MESRDEKTLPATRAPRSRKSLSHLPSAELSDKENMTADIGGLMGSKRAVLGERQSKKSRSKSIGPGGLDALKDSNGNRRKSIAAPPPKSILKPTMLPLPEIPVHKVTHKLSLKKETQSLAETTDSQQSTFALDQNSEDELKASVTGIEGLANPFAMESNPAVVETKVLLRTEEEQQAAAREREEKERPEAEAEADVNSRREARRKSLANRRVSFAPEATLHTWDVVEYLQDSTTSSASTNSTRRVSSASIGTPGTPGPPGSDPSEPPSTPPEQVEDLEIVSPERQRDLHQKKRRRSSGIPPLNFNNPDDFSLSPFSESSVEGDEENVDQAFQNVEDNLSESESDLDDEGTAMSIEVGDNTDVSIASGKSTASSTGSSIRLEQALELAARQAGTLGIEFDEHGDLETAEEEQDESAVAPFQSWSKGSRFEDGNPSQDQENLNPFSPAFKNGLGHRSSNKDDGEEDMTMEITQAVGKIMPSPQSDDEMTMDMTIAMGGIIASQPTQSPAPRRKSAHNTRRQSTRRKSAGEDSSLGDETMDLTMAIGGIQQGTGFNENVSDANEDEDMTMEFTSVVGGVLAAPNPSKSKVKKRTSMAPLGKLNTKRQSTDSAGDITMDMTAAVGNIMTGDNSNEENVTVGIDLTTSLKSIIPQQISSQEQAGFMKSPLPHLQGTTIASDTGSPSLAAFKGKGLRRSVGPRASTTPKSSVKKATIGSPLNKPSTPSKQITPKSSRPTTPAKATPKILSGTPSKQLSENDGVNAPSPKASVAKKSATPNRLFQKSSATGAATPNIILTPQKRRTSGIGIDRDGLGSPRVAAILDRRMSLGDRSLAFKVGENLGVGQGVRFDDYRTLNEEIDAQAQYDRDREDGRKIMEREADSAETEKDATINLKEMIESLTPKKRSLKGRKSLHVGAAKGLLGKRPVELDDEHDDNDESQDGIKRIKNLQGSPVKNIKLQAPPSKAETTGRLTRATRRSLDVTNGNVTTPTLATSPLKNSKITTPKSQCRFKNPEPQSAAKGPAPFLEKDPVENPVVNEDEFEDERMHLQDFLNMTSIRFMELTTTKRRHTIAPNALQEGSRDSDAETKDISGSFQSCVVAGACTIPMLELFQHSCRELKKYISEGRKVVREIETETFEENPPLFREYISAAPDFRALMDNQFKNVKTHARLLSKATWYEWRMKLLDGLKDGLKSTKEGMEADAEILQHQQDLLESVLPSLIREYEAVAGEESELQAAAEELASCDQEELSEARQRLVSVEADVEVKMRMIQDLQNQMHEKETAIAVATETRQSCLDDIQEAEKVRELCRGWSADEGLAFKAKVDDLEKLYGWAITGVSGYQVSMTFRREIELVFDASSFKPNKGDAKTLQSVSSRIDLWYIASNRELNPLPLTTEKDFFLQNIREHCRGLPQAHTTVKALLDAVSVPWTTAMQVMNDIRTLKHDCLVEIVKTSDSSIVVRSALLLVPLSTKVDLEFHVQVSSTRNCFDVEVTPAASICYGERFNEAKMTEFLVTKTAEKAEKKRSWGDVVEELKLRLLARGRK